jgi:hypothetical protein
MVTPVPGEKKVNEFKPTLNKIDGILLNLNDSMAELQAEIAKLSAMVNDDK